MVTVIVDGNYCLHRCMKVKALAELESRKGMQTGGIFGSLNSIQGTLSTNQADRCIVVFDGGISERRREIYPAYKGARARLPGDPFYEEPDADKQAYMDSFRLQQRKLSMILSKLGVHVVKLKGWEADDVIAAIVWHCSSDSIPIYVVSDDKDMMQLAHEEPGSDVRIIRPIAKQVIRGSYLDPAFLIKKAIMGDSSDNISGIPGVGKTTIERMFEEGAPAVGLQDINELFAWCDGHSNKRIQKVADNIDVVMRNYELIALHFEDHTKVVPLIRESLSVPTSVEMLTVKKYMQEFDLYSILKDFAGWIVPFQKLRNRQLDSDGSSIEDSSVEPDSQNEIDRIFGSAHNAQS